MAVRSTNSGRKPANSFVVDDLQKLPKTGKKGVRVPQVLVGLYASVGIQSQNFCEGIGKYQPYQAQGQKHGDHILPQPLPVSVKQQPEYIAGR